MEETKMNNDDDFNHALEYIKYVVNHYTDTIW